MHMGTMKFKQRGREEQAEADGTEVINKLGSFCSSRLKLSKYYRRVSVSLNCWVLKHQLST